MFYPKLLLVQGKSVLVHVLMASTFNSECYNDKMWL